jgi:hypothetical protein
MVIVQESTSPKYPARTFFNAKSGDVTLALAVDLTTAGEKLTHTAAGEKYVGFQINPNSDPIDVARGLYKFMKKRNAKTLNIAGNGIYTLVKHGFTQEDINNFLCDVIEKVHQFWPIEKIFSGGQTGVDLAGAVVAQYLNIPALITLPKGYIQRFEDNKDITQTQDKVYEQINHWVEKLVKLDEERKLIVDLPENNGVNRRTKKLPGN